AALAVDPGQRRSLAQPRARFPARIAEDAGCTSRRLEVAGRRSLVTHGATHESAFAEQGKRGLLVIGEPTDEIERMLERVERFPVRQPTCCISGRLSKIRHGAGEIAPALEVLGHLR